MDATGFPSLRENRFFPLKRRHSDVTGARNLPQTMRWCLHWLSSSIFSEVMADHNFVRQNFGARGDSRV